MGKMHINRYHDGANAFFCVKHGIVGTSLRSVYDWVDMNLARDRYFLAEFYLKDSIGDVLLVAGEGLLPGDYAGTLMFVYSYVGELHDKLDECKTLLGWNKFSEAECVINKKSVQINTTSFVDDVGDKVFGDNEVEIVFNAEIQNQFVDEGMAMAGSLQNFSKQENVPVISGDGSRPIMKRLIGGETTVQGKTLVNARHLGATIDANFGFNIERQHRTQAMTIAWSTMSRFWVSDAKKKLRVSAFVGHVVSAGCTGLEAFAAKSGPITENMVAPIQTRKNRYARAVLLGRTIKWEEDHPRVMKTTQVMREIKTAPVFPLLRMRRLKWL